MERRFSLSHEDAVVVYHALQYYASDLLESFVDDDESEVLQEAVHANELAEQLQMWLVSTRQSLLRDTS